MTARHCLVLLIAIGALAGCSTPGASRQRPDYLTAGARQAAQGQALYEKGCYNQALEHFLRAHELHAALDQTEDEAWALNSIGSVYRVLGDPANAVLFFAEALSLFEENNNRKGARLALSNMAAALISLDRLEEAQAVLDRAGAIRVPGEMGPFGPLLNTRGVLLYKQGDFPGAEMILRQALEAAPESDFGGRANAHASLGSLMMDTQRFAEARGHFQQALDADRRNGFYKGVADDLDNLARACLAMGDAKAAAGAWKRSAQAYAMLGMEQQTQAIVEVLRPLAGQTQTDLSVMDFFLQRWQENKQYESPCGK